MSVAPSPTAARGEITLQPSYFTSSLFVHPLRDDILHLIRAFHDQYFQTRPTQPFALFKAIWNIQGWTWMHLKVFDARARETFLRVTARLFLERMLATEAPISRVVALFGLYTFLSTQPTSSAPSLHFLTRIAIPTDHYNSLMTFPSTLTTEQLLPLQPHVTYILSKIVESRMFYILPPSELHPLNPRELPREIFFQSGYDTSAPSYEQFANESSHSTLTTDRSKKKGRPSKRDKLQKAKDALKNLEKWLEKTNYAYPNTNQDPPTSSSHQAASTSPCATHVLLSHPPTTTRNYYQTQKSNLLESLAPHPVPLASGASSSTVAEHLEGLKVLERANNAVVSRLRKIDQMAAEKGLEVGGEGGDRTGLERVERAATELDNGRGGILGLLEGGGVMGSEEMSAELAESGKSVEP